MPRRPLHDSPRSPKLPTFPAGGVPLPPDTGETAIAATKRASTRRVAYSTGDTANITEASYQYDIIQVATMNGWRIDASHCLPESDLEKNGYVLTNPLRRVRAYLTRVFKRQGLSRPLAFLLEERRKPWFTLAYHTHNSEKSQKGFPDLVLVHPERPQVYFIELKDEKKYPTLEQRLWAAALLSVEEEYPDAVCYRLWRPRHYYQAVEELGGIDPLAA